MDKNTLKNALGMLDLHKHYSETTERTAEQAAYYKGLRDMLDIILSEAHTSGLYTAINSRGKHTTYQMSH